MSMINRSKQQIKAIYQGLAMKKTLRMLSTDKIQVPIPERTFDIKSLNLEEFLAVHKKYYALAKESDSTTKDKNSKELFIGDKNKNVKPIKSLPSETSSHKKIGTDNGIFFIHDENGQTTPRPTSDLDSFLNESSYNFMSYTQDIKIVLEDETISSTSSKNIDENFEQVDKDEYLTDYYSSTENYPHSLTTESARNSVNGSINLSWFSESMKAALFQKLGIKSSQASPNETSLDSYSVEETEDGFVEVSL